MAKDTIAKASKNPKDKPTKAEKQAMKTKLRNLGLKLADVNALLDENDSTLDAEKIEKTIREWLKDRPKGGK